MRAPTALALTTTQIIAAVKRLDQQTLADATLAGWAQQGIAVPSVRYERIRGKRGRLYSLTDLARVRLVARLRREGLPMQRLRVVLALLERELPEVLKPNTKAVLLVNGTRGVILRRPGQADREIPGDQLRLPLAEVVKGNLEAAKAAIAA